MTRAEESVLFLNHVQDLLSQCHLHDTICRNILLGYSWERSPPACGRLYLMILVTRLDGIVDRQNRACLYQAEHILAQAECLVRITIGQIPRQCPDQSICSEETVTVIC